MVSHDIWWDSDNLVTPIFLNWHFPSKQSRVWDPLRSPVYEGVPTSNREGPGLWECAYGFGLDIGCVRSRVSLEQ